jgi:hypothetical protein
MSNPSEDHDDDAESDRASAEFDAELTRVGVTPQALVAELARRAATWGGGRGPTLGFWLDFEPMTEALRRLPDGAGVGPVADWVCGTEIWRTLREYTERAPDA